MLYAHLLLFVAQQVRCMRVRERESENETTTTDKFMLLSFTSTRIFGSRTLEKKVFLGFCE